MVLCILRQVFKKSLLGNTFSGSKGDKLEQIVQSSQFYCKTLISKYKMQAQQPDTFTENRSQKMRLLRHSLKKLPLVTQRSDKLEEKSRKMRQRKLSNSSQPDSLGESTIFEVETPMREVLEEEETNNLFEQNFLLLQKLGEGCNACVYRCFHRASKRPYAVKKIKVEEEHVQQLRKDFITLKELNSNYICKYKGLYFDETERVAFLVMEHLPFPSLQKYRPKAEGQLRIICSQLLEAIEYLHNRNICHRDIKPQNILFDPGEERIKIIDFGVSKKTFLRGARRDMLTIIGTHFYLAPEVYLGGGYDERIDLWALGITIYRIVAGYTPFESEYHSETVANILKGQLSFSYSRWSKFSPQLKTFVGQLLKKVDERMTLSEAKAHLWLENSETSSPKLRRNSSHNILLNKDFHEEFKHKVTNAQAKEEGSAMGESRIFKKINTLQSKNFHLEDSDDEDSIVSPEANRFRQTFSAFQSGISLFAMVEKEFCRDS